MKTKILLAAMATTMVMYMLSSCYRNREDILQVPVEKVSFRKMWYPLLLLVPVVVITWETNHMHSSLTKTLSSMM